MRRRYSRGIVTMAWALVWLAGCGGGGAAFQGPEAELSPAHPIAPASSSFRAQALLPFEIEYQEEGAARIVFSPGGDADSMVCNVYDEAAELGATALRLIGGGRDFLDEQLGDFALKQLSGMRVGAIEGAPYHSVEWTYSDPEKGAAHIKAAAANKQGRGIACLDMNLGHQQTFWQVFERLVASFENASPPPTPYFEEVVVSSIGPMEVGVTSMQFTLDDDGDTQILSTTSLLIPTSIDDMLVSYQTRVDWARPDGTLINAHVIDVDLENVTTNLSLTREDAGWWVRGLFKGKELDSGIEGDARIATFLSEYREVRDLLMPKGEEHALRIVQWQPSADPLGFLEARVEVEPEDPSRYTMRLGPLTSRGRRGQDGLVESSVVHLGVNELHSKVVHRRGGL